MKFLGLFKNSSLLKLALGIAIVAIGYLIAMFYFQMKDLNNSVDAIAVANQSQFQLEQLLSKGSIYESNLKSFILTKDSIYLKKNLELRKQLDSHLNTLKKQGVQNKSLTLNLSRLNLLIAKRYNLIDQILVIASKVNYNKTPLINKLLENDSNNNDIRILVNELIKKESDKVQIQQNKHAKGVKDSTETASVLALLSLFIFLLSYSKMNADITAQIKANDELKFLNETFNNAEKIASFGHWKVNLRTNVYTLSDNFYRIMGFEPQSFEPKLDMISQYIHPEDIDGVLKTHKDSLINHEPTSIVFRYLLKNGEVKYIKSVGSFRTNVKGDLVKIGVNYDITDQYMNTIKLSENNQKLIDINAELESFNSIVSHDLQEPLRKIQMFISRLEASEIQTLSDKGKDYFSKIRSSANRMQNLMIDLVNYTRAVKGDRIFIKTDLNALIKEVIEELSLNFEEKNAKIEIGNLPTINAIPFQIQQLFINLISNSLKYSKLDVPPEISIKEEQITESFLHDEKRIDSNGFHKISITDNGIGFRQEYAEGIFILFKRLETENTYSGTGLGLAICKKIAENHNGFIAAFGEPNVGAKFFIYLPK